MKNWTRRVDFNWRTKDRTKLGVITPKRLESRKARFARKTSGQSWR